MITTNIRCFNNIKPLLKEEYNVIEQEVYNELIIDESTKEGDFDIKKVNGRKETYFIEKDYNKPQNIFFIEYEDIVIWGRKIISELYIHKLIKSKNCSMINKNMIVGILKNYRKEGRDIKITYIPLTDGERINVFTKIKKRRNYNIYYPFKYFDYDSLKEVVSPTDGWKIYSDTEITLFNGEKHLREYTINFLDTLNIEKGSVFFDPACSTGDFLYTIKKKYPNIIAIGQDLGKDMVECATPKLDKVYYGDSINTPVLDDSVDFLFLRFLNFRVVSTSKAKELYDILIKKVKVDGYVICFGHTPVLLSINELKKDNFELISCNGYTSKYDSIFQYYILRRKK